MYMLKHAFVCVQAQLVVLAAQISWSEMMEKALQEVLADNNKDALSDVFQAIKDTLNVLADSVLHEQPPVRRKKLESLVSFLCKYDDYFVCEIVSLIYQYV